MIYNVLEAAMMKFPQLLISLKFTRCGDVSPLRSAISGFLNIITRLRSLLPTLIKMIKIIMTTSF